MLFNIPNGLTMTRCVGSLCIWPMLAYEEPSWMWVTPVSLTFIFLCATDYFDGYFARRWNQHTVFGERLDPIADKVLVVLTIVVLLKYHDFAVLTRGAMALVLLREITVSGVREYLRRIGETMPTIRAAKVKTGFQMTGLGFMVVGDALDALLLLSEYPVTVRVIGESIFIIGALLGFHSAWRSFKLPLALLTRTKLSRRR